MRKQARQRAPKPSANMETRKAGRVAGATQLVTFDLRSQAVERYLQGASVPEIAREMGKSEISVYGYISHARIELIKAKKERYVERLALQLDDNMDAIAINSQLLADSDWLKTAEPERIDAISRAYGILSDKCFVLLAAGRNSGTVAPSATGAEAVSG